MKSKQLANVLIKILGLSVCLYAIPSFISSIVVGLSSLGLARESAPVILRMISYGIGAAVQSAVGICFIVKSKSIVEFLFKGEEE